MRAPPTPDSVALARVFHALANVRRVQLVDLLRRSECCVCAVCSALGEQQSLVSFHLKVLKDAGIIEDRRTGRWVYYALTPHAASLISTLFQCGRDVATTRPHNLRTP